MPSDGYVGGQSWASFSKSQTRPIVKMMGKPFMQGVSFLHRLGLCEWAQGGAEELDRRTEREILLKRFFGSDRRLYSLGKAARIEWFSKFDVKFGRDRYAYFAEDERKEARERIIVELDDNTFISSLNQVEKPNYMDIDRFVGEYYYFDSRKGGLFRLEDKRDEVRAEVQGILRDTNGRGYDFLKSIILLYKEGVWDKAYGGAVWTDILSKMRELGGGYPSPRDIAIIKSYRIYYKTGSIRYPTHTIPEEMMSTIDGQLSSGKQLEGAP